MWRSTSRSTSLCVYRESAFIVKIRDTLKVCRKKLKDDSLKRLTEENNDHEEDDAIYSMYYLSSQKPRPPIIIKISVAGCVIPIEVDTDASTSVSTWRPSRIYEKEHR